MPTHRSVTASTAFRADADGCSRQTCPHTHLAHPGVNIVCSIFRRSCWCNIRRFRCSLWADDTLKALVGGGDGAGSGARPWRRAPGLSQTRARSLNHLRGAGGGGTAAPPETFVSHFRRQSGPSEGWRIPFRILANSKKNLSIFH